LCMGIALMAAGHWRLRENKIAVVCLAAAVAVTPMTGARWNFYMIVLAVPVFLYGMARSSMLNTRHVWRLIGLSLVGAVAISYWSMEALESLEYRRQSTSDAPGRVEELLSDPVKFGAEAGVLGYGAGATHQAATVLFKEAGYYSWLPLTDFEDEPGRIMLELGVVGFIVVFALRIYLCLLAWRAMLNGENRAEKALAIAALVFFIAHLVSPVVFNVTGGALYWFLAGVVALILREQHVRRALTQPAAPRPLGVSARALR
jgi:hypothetical protein